MTFYESEIKKIRALVYANQHQLDTVIGTRNYLDNHFDADLTLDLLSHLRCTSKFHLLRLFRRYYGITPKQYLTDIRIEKSKENLRKGMTVSETCFAIGFESPASFCTLFKVKTGLTPTGYQKKQLSQSRIDPDSAILSIEIKY